MNRATSLRVKVPLAIAIASAGLVTVWTIVASRIVRDSAITLGEERLAQLTSALAFMYENTARELQGQLRTAAANATLVAAAADGTPGSEATARARAAMARSIAGLNYRMALFALDGTPVLAVPDSAPAPTLERHEELASVFASARTPPFSALGHVRQLDGVPVVPIVGAILRDSVPIGFVVLWRRVAAAQRAQTSVASLLGAGTTVMIGNARGDIWTGESGPRRLPPALETNATAAHYQREDGADAVVSARGIPGTPWAVAAETLTDSIAAPATRFVERSLQLGVIVVALATAGGWLVSRRLTGPLHELTVATSEVAAGEYHRHVPVHGRDEIGSLGVSFNTMVDRVADAHHKLEGTVAERTRELVDRNSDLEAFAHSISHDLRAPLRAMHGFSRALLDDCGDSLDATGQDYARRIAAAALRMDVLTQDLLSYSKVSRTEMPLAPVALDGAVRAAVSQLEADVESRKARITVADALPSVVAHRASLEQSVANLVSNAMKFVAPDVTPHVTIRAETAGRVVRLWVEDNGIGIEPAHQERIFGVFERLHSPQQFAGTGIGLAIVRRAVERMGGRAGVHSSPGTGSRFWIELNLAEHTA